MYGKFHLYTCIFRIHWFHTKSLGTNNLNFFIVLIICIDEIRCKAIRYIHFLRSQLCTIFSQLTLDYFFY